VGEVNLLVKVQGLSWKFPFLVMKDLTCGLILDIDFIGKTGLVLDILKQEYYFHSDAEVRYKLSLPDPSGFENRQIHNIDNISDSHKSEFSIDHLTPCQRVELEKVLDKYLDVLTERLGLTHLIKYHIHLKDSIPVKSPPYRLAPPKMQILQQHIQKLLEEDVIEMSASQYASPMFLVPKADDSYRAVVDFRALTRRLRLSQFHCLMSILLFTGFPEQSISLCWILIRLTIKSH
jgi:hypothetical protein